MYILNETFNNESCLEQIYNKLICILYLLSNLIIGWVLLLSSKVGFKRKDARE